jgi:hypothetical protein
LAQAKVQGFAEVLAAKDAEDGISALYVVLYSNSYLVLSFLLHRIQTEGLGGLRPNTVVLCWPGQWKKDFDSYTAEAFIRKRISLITIDLLI